MDTIGITQTIINTYALNSKIAAEAKKLAEASGPKEQVKEA